MYKVDRNLISMPKVAYSVSMSSICRLRAGTWHIASTILHVMARAAGDAGENMARRNQLLSSRVNVTVSPDNDKEKL